MMKPVVKKATPAAIAVLRQATAISPSRKKASDGLLPSRAHLKQNPNSDHNCSNPHKNHIHISIKENHSKDTSPWFAWLDRPVYKTADQARLAALKIKPLPKKKVKK